MRAAGAVVDEFGHEASSSQQRSGSLDQAAGAAAQRGEDPTLSNCSLHLSLPSARPAAAPGGGASHELQLDEGEEMVGTTNYGGQEDDDEDATQADENME